MGVGIDGIMEGIAVHTGSNIQPERLAHATGSVIKHVAKGRVVVSV